MDVILNNTKIDNIIADITITGSKSESNRLLILQQLYSNLQITNLSNSKDSQVLQKAFSSKETKVDIGHAGTAMRFLTAYFSTIEGNDVVLTGSSRMQNRPIRILVDALRILGADITYEKKEGYPPLRIRGKSINVKKVSINGNVSSQYVSALLLIAPSLKNGLIIELLGEITSRPYLQMTLDLLRLIGVKAVWEDNIIQVYPKQVIENTTITVESDWSSASYYYSVVALSVQGKINLSYFQKESLQGDKALATLFLNLGVKTTFFKRTILLEKIVNFKQKKHLVFNLVQTPDIAQTIAVTCLGIGVSCGLTGLHTLKIKETDRLVALKQELQKFGGKVRITEDSLHLKSPNELQRIDNPIDIETYDDHRMAMAFAPLSLKAIIQINDAEVVNKSYPDFWKDFKF